MDEVRLSFRRPNRAAWTIAVAVARSIKGDDAVILGGQINQPAGLKVLDHATVAMQEDQRGSRTPLDVVEANAAHMFGGPPTTVTRATAAPDAAMISW